MFTDKDKEKLGGRWVTALSPGNDIEETSRRSHPPFPSLVSFYYFLAGGGFGSGVDRGEKGVRKNFIPLVSRH